ncbi:N-acyl homoserine lactonase family protein [Bradyrhizobium sp. ERR14]|uniref:N-acyl homoserine lactonase family protein n=1 Tax=Bradyrhizobium sp. ERR14 TaxID=2663837 RepID=UPI00161E178A|nr:N-acyl homoserine lactonase family protein [Bradyrhizobium sp. ERR14]MBB4392206.1 glyoxylase-like metal-dependent hydrolase (beta-lactamase superfamily II) [Bradyrhizobium sp. ERR14]
MMPRITFAVALAALVLSGPAALAQSEKAGVEKLYVLNCGEGTAGDISRWTPGLNEGKSMDFVDTCYLVKHSKGWFLWDTGIADSVASMPDGLVPADPKAVTWRRPKTLAAQLEQLGLKPDDVKAMAVSHTHPDHTGNVELFPQATLYVQKAEYDWPGANNQPRFKPSHPVELLNGDKDVFGDGSVTILSTPGHTPGHQSLLVKLPKTGAVVLSGDAVHFRDNWDNRRVPSMNVDKDQTAASMQKIADTLAKEKAQLWINHDKAQRDSQKLAPEFYD